MVLPEMDDLQWKTLVIKMDDLGVPRTPILGNLHMKTIALQLLGGTPQFMNQGFWIDMKKIIQYKSQQQQSAPHHVLE